MKTSYFRIFVSSTFSDLKAERNALQERILQLRWLHKSIVRNCEVNKIEEVT